MAEGKKIKLKLKKKEGAAVSEAPPVSAPTPIPSTRPPKITLKGVKIRIEEVNLAKKK